MQLVRCGRYAYVGAVILAREMSRRAQEGSSTSLGTGFGNLMNTERGMNSSSVYDYLAETHWPTGTRETQFEVHVV